MSFRSFYFVGKPCNIRFRLDNNNATGSDIRIDVILPKHLIPFRCFRDLVLTLIILEECIIQFIGSFKKIKYSLHNNKKSP